MSVQTGAKRYPSQLDPVDRRWPFEFLLGRPGQQRIHIQGPRVLSNEFGSGWIIFDQKNFLFHGTLPLARSEISFEPHIMISLSQGAGEAVLDRGGLSVQSPNRPFDQANGL